MNTKIDTFIEIGSQHQMCEDYIISGNNYIILADGCSSSKRSEMGARFLCYMARQYIKEVGVHPSDMEFAETMGSWIIHDAEMLSRTLGIKKTCLDATLIVAFIKEGTLYIYMYGDGCVVAQPKNAGQHEFELYEVDFKSDRGKSMPFYLRYLLDRDGSKLYHEAKVIKSLYTYLLSYDDVSEPKRVVYAYDHPIVFEFDIHQYKSVSITSDGLGSFLKLNADDNGNKILKAAEMVPLIFDFKSNSAGVFLQRQMNICKRALKKNGLPFDHFDDLSIGTFLFEDESHDQDSKVN